MTRPAIALSLALLPGCFVEVSTMEQTATLDEPIHAVLLDVDAGGTEIVATDATQVSVHQTLAWTGDCPETSMEVVDGVLMISARCDEGDFWCSAEHRIELPAEVAIAAKLGSGGLSVSGTSGPIQVELGSGGVELTDVDGAVQLELGSGGIDLVNVRGSLDLELGSGGITGVGLNAPQLSANTGSGGMSLALDSAPELAVLSAGSGGIELLVPAGAYDLQADAGSGGVDISNITNDQDAPNKLQLSVGSGGISVVGQTLAD